MIEEKLDKIKSQYQNTELPQYLIYNGWADLKFTLPIQQNHFWNINLKRGLIFASTCLFVTTTVAGIAQASKPGNTLYPIKTLTQDIKANITGNYQEKVEKRAQDVLDLSTKSQDKLDKAIEKYQKTAKESLEKTKDDQKYNDLNKSIEQHNQEIKKIEERDSNYSNSREDDKSNTEVKGQKSSESENRNSENKSNQEENTQSKEHQSENSDSE